MYRLKVKVGSKWIWGLNDYTYELAVERVLELKSKGIQSKIKHINELLK